MYFWTNLLAERYVNELWHNLQIPAALSGSQTGAEDLFVVSVLEFIKSCSQNSFSSGVSANTVNDLSLVMIWNAFLRVGVSGRGFTLVFTVC